ncbi:MAG: Ig-like domain-containing protein [Bacteroidota bacterium]|nr:Ig-like domain-containing protein [Bacteroidota bacterium]
MRIFLLLFVLTTLVSNRTFSQLPYPLPAPQDTTQFGRYLQRTMKLLATSTPTKRNTVKILVYGQSIAKQEWSDTVRKYLKIRFPYANIIMINRSIGGCWAGCLQDPVAYDVSPFYPDLILFDVYGWSGSGGNQGPEYENIISYFRTNTTAEVGMQTHHVTPGDSAGGNDPSDFIRLRDKYGVEIIDVRTPWFKYLRDNNKKATQLTSDGSHLNDQGNFLMARLWMPYLQYKPQFASDTFNLVKTYKVGTDIFWVNGVLTLPFNGNKVTIVTSTPQTGTDSAIVMIDNQKPSTLPGVIMFNRPNEPYDTVFKHFSQYDWPWQKAAIMKFNPGFPKKVENWTLTFTSYTNTTNFSYSVAGSKTGADGNGSYSGNAVFTSTSKIVVIDRSKFWLNTGPYSNTFLTTGYTIKWQAMPFFSNSFKPPITTTSSVIDSVVTLAQGISNTNHTLVLTATGSKNVPIKEIKIYQPYYGRVLDNFTILSPLLLVTSPGVLCLGNAVNLANTFRDANSLAGIVTYWQDAAATISVTSPNFITVSGTYYIKKQAFVAGRSDIKPVVVQIVTCQPNLQVTQPQAVCAPSVIDLSSTYNDVNSVSGIVSYWRDSGATLTVTSPFSVSISGVYFIKKVGTVGGLSDIKPVTVTVNSMPNTSVFAPNSICSGMTITASATGANTYTWFPGSLSGGNQNLSPSTTTTYTLVGNSLGCIKNSIFTISVSSTPVLGLSGATSICSGTGTALTASGATFYNWLPGSLTGSIQNLTPLFTTNYTLTGSFSSGCSSKILFTVSVSGVPFVNVNGNNTICNGQIASLTASGTSNFMWLPGSITGAILNISPTVTGLFTVIGSNGGLCQNAKVVTVTVNSLPGISTSGVFTTCSAISTTINAIGGVSYLWFPGSITGNSAVFSPLNTTNYTLVGTNAQGCSSSTNFTITVSSLPLLTLTGNSTICKFKTTNIIASGANNYTWQPGGLIGSNQSLSPSNTIIYSITGTNSNGCSSIKNVTITVNNLPSVSVTGTSACYGFSSSLIASGANSYVWFPGSIVGSGLTISPTISGVYTVSGTDANGCINTSTGTFTVDPLPVLSISGNYTICSNTGTNISVAGAIFYAWQPSGYIGTNNLMTPSSTTNYTITGTSNKGCIGYGNFTITVNGLPTISTSGNFEICSGSSTSISASGANTYNWIPGNLAGSINNLTPSNTTNYTVIGTNSNNCVSSKIFTVTVNSLPNIQVSGPNFICTNSSTSLSASGANLFNWMPGNVYGTINNTTLSSPIVYTITGTTSSGCFNYTTYAVNVAPQLSISISGNNNICAGSSTTLTATGATNYTWLPGNLTGNIQNFSPSTNTSITVTGTSGTCSSNQTFAIAVQSLPLLTILGPSRICKGNTAILTVSGANNYLWFPTSISGNQVSLNPSITSVYTVIGTINNCSNSTSQMLIVDNLPSVSISGTNSICGNTLSTYSAIGASQYVWQPGNFIGNSFITSIAGNTVLTLTGTDANNCSNKVLFSLYLKPAPSSVQTIIGPDFVNTSVLSGFRINQSVNSITYWTATGTNVGIQGSDSTKISWSNPGSYSISVSNQNSCGTSNVFTKTVSVTSPVIIPVLTGISIIGTNSIDYNAGTVQLNAMAIPSSALLPTIVWSISDSTLAKVNQDGLVTALKNGVITITATVITNSQIQQTFVMTISGQSTPTMIGTNIQNALNIDLKIWPNPAKNVLNISNNGTVKDISVLDVYGSLVLQTKIESGISKIDIPFIQGIYFLITDNQRIKFVIE